MESLGGYLGNGLQLYIITLYIWIEWDPIQSKTQTFKDIS